MGINARYPCGNRTAGTLAVRCPLIYTCDEIAQNYTHTHKHTHTGASKAGGNMNNDVSAPVSWL